MFVLMLSHTEFSFLRGKQQPFISLFDTAQQEGRFDSLYCKRVCFDAYSSIDKL